MKMLPKRRECFQLETIQVSFFANDNDWLWGDVEVLTITSQLWEMGVNPIFRPKEKLLLKREAFL